MKKGHRKKGPQGGRDKERRKGRKGWYCKLQKQTLKMGGNIKKEKE